MNDIIINKLYADAGQPSVQRLQETAGISADSEDSGLAGGGYSFDQEQQDLEDEYQRKRRQLKKRQATTAKDVDADQFLKMELSQLERRRALSNAAYLGSEANSELRLVHALKSYGASRLSEIDDHDLKEESGTNYCI